MKLLLFLNRKNLGIRKKKKKKEKKNNSPLSQLPPEKKCLIFQNVKQMSLQTYSRAWQTTTTVVILIHEATTREQDEVAGFLSVFFFHFLGFETFRST